MSPEYRSWSEHDPAEPAPVTVSVLASSCVMGKVAAVLGGSDVLSPSVHVSSPEPETGDQFPVNGVGAGGGAASTGVWQAHADVPGVSELQ